MAVVTEEIEIAPDEYIYVDFEGDPSYEDVGIGSYEYWGFRGNDSSMQWVLEDIQWDKSQYSDDVNTIIQKYFEKNMQDIENQLIKIAENSY
jgi:hypothetical protein